MTMAIKNPIIVGTQNLLYVPSTPNVQPRQELIRQIRTRSQAVEACDRTGMRCEIGSLVLPLGVEESVKGEEAEVLRWRLCWRSAKIPSGICKANKAKTKIPRI